MNETATQAISNPKYFPVAKRNFSAFQTLYGLVQCTRHLSTSNYNVCLRDCCRGKQGGRVLFPSCDVREKRSLIISDYCNCCSSCCLCSSFYCGLMLPQKERKAYNAVAQENADNDISTPIAIDLATIEVATIRFSTDNKLGEGRFGDVYKNKLADGKAIAVKRLSRASGQGLRECKNQRQSQ
ncbi:Cysteine-rich receptor-kinase-like protein [Melia azedarach]|uniref:Cysteine-rich receptor-kinase-like protein n=1 Tax=Melia azedarach TaxID=155640 RepID=A0ACC1WWD8_MELAZ|nr:Cysteine-rich receptor-kinase-like protein [Melia azedarach]